MMPMAYTINKYHGSYNIVRRTSQVKYIVVHYVGAGTSKAGSAKANCIYFSKANRNASAHYFIDDGYIYEYADPKKYATWHCGDGKGKYGITNQNSIGIEVCINGNNPFTQEEIKRLTWLVQKLMKDYNIAADHVVRHYDASRKQCPKYYVNGSRWAALHAQITGGKVAVPAPTTVPSNSSIGSYKVRITCDALNIRAGAGTKYKITGCIRDKGIYTIVETKNGWGKLKSGVGWISLAYTKKV